MSNKVGLVEKPGAADLRARDFAGFDFSAKGLRVHLQDLCGLGEGQEHGSAFRHW